MQISNEYWYKFWIKHYERKFTWTILKEDKTITMIPQKVEEITSIQSMSNLNSDH